MLGWKSRHDAERAVERRQEARRRHRRLAFLAFGALIGLALMGILTAWAFVERDRARHRAVEARARELEARAVTLFPTDASLALVLAAEAARTAPSATTEDVLRQALILDRLLYVLPAGGPVVDVDAGMRGGFFAGTTSGIARRYGGGAVGASRRPQPDLEARYSGAVTTVGPDPSGMLSASRDGVARLTVDPASGRSNGGLVLRGRQPVVALESVACGSSAGCLVTGAGKHVWVWDRRGGRRLGSIAVPAEVAELVPWSKTGVAVRTRPGGLVVVDVGTERVRRTLVTRHPVRSIAADPGRHLVAAGLDDGTVVVWSTVTGEVETQYAPHIKAVLALDLANGMVLSGASAGAAAVRNLATKRTIPLGGHSNVIRSVELSADGQFAVTASADHTAKVWATDDGRGLSVLTGHDDVVTDATFIDGARRRSQGWPRRHGACVGQRRASRS